MAGREKSPADTLARELAYYREHQEEFAVEHYGEVVLIQDETVGGSFLLRMRRRTLLPSRAGTSAHL